MNNPAGFSGFIKIYKYVKEQGDFQISRSYLRTWLSKQETCTLHRPSRQHFKRPRVLIFQENQEWDTDCAHLRQFADDNQGYSYFVVFIHIFTRYLYTRL